MFRARVLAQGFTVVAMVAGSMYYGKDREKTAELRKLKEQTDAEEKRAKWIRELEVRDEEEKSFKTKLQEKVHAAEASIANEEAAVSNGKGGILSKIGLWPKEDNKVPEETKPENSEDAAPEKKPKRDNPKSSLGAIGEVISTQKKDGSGKKSD